MNRLKLLRTKCNLTLRDLENYVGIGNGALSLIENEKQPFREIHVLKLTSFFDVTSDYLLGYSDRGIGIYFNDDHEYISEDEISKISGIKRKIITTPSSNVKVILPNIKLQSYTGKHSVYRYVEVDKEQVSIENTLIEKINQTLKVLDTRDLGKVLKFINEYIK